MALVEATTMAYRKRAIGQEYRIGLSKVRHGKTGFWVGILIKTETTGEETILGPE